MNNVYQYLFSRPVCTLMVVTSSLLELYVLVVVFSKNVCVSTCNKSNIVINNALLNKLVIYLGGQIIDNLPTSVN